jgi:nicotinate-nucleotide pyrophosphorylase (carboxylating)
MNQEATHAEAEGMPNSRRGKSDLSLILPTSTLNDLVHSWLSEDLPSFDYGGTVVGDREEKAILLCKSPGVLAGCPFFEAVFKHLNCKVKWLASEGTQLVPVCTVAEVTGRVNRLLMGERVALNCITRASGVATKAKRLAELKQMASWAGEVAGTRKTTPGFRLVEKYALLVGGISTHRYDQSSMIMLKDNHIWSVGSVSSAVKAARKTGGFTIKIEVECRNIAEAREAARSGADIIMLDNFTSEALHSTARVLKEEFPHVTLEASGGINEGNITNYFGPHIDVVSLGSLTQGYECIDFSLKIQKEGRDPRNPTVKEDILELNL